MVPLDELNFDEAVADHGHMHVPCPYLFIHQALKLIGENVQGVTFVDYGCGLGRVLFFATRFPFRKIIGVEASPDLSQEASKNLDKFFKAKRISKPEWKIIQGNATEFVVPDDASVFFFNDPFDETVMTPVVAKICRSQEKTPRNVYVVYVNPGHPDIFRDQGFTLVERTVNRHNKGFILYKR